MSRLLITGGSGDLGRPLSALAAQYGETHSTYLTHPDTGGGDPIRLDLRDRDAVLATVDRLHPEAIIHTAVSDRSPAVDVVCAARNIAEAACRAGARLVALSTDMVFDGMAPPYSEQSPPSPLSDYGRAKAEGEQVWLTSGAGCVIVRTSLIYDFDVRNRQVSWMIDRIGRGEMVPLFADEIRNPVYAPNLSAALLELAAAPFRGVIHIAGPEPMSRLAYGSLLLEAFGYDAARHVQAVKAAEVAPQRPRDLTLDLSLAGNVLQTRMLNLREAVTTYSSGQATAQLA